MGQLARQPAAALGGTGLWGDLLATGYYRPLVQASLVLDNFAGGGSPLAFHLTNLLLHLAMVMAAWLLFLRLSGRWQPATLAATLFAVHPVHVEAVAWISGRGDLLAPLLGLCGWLALMQGGWLPGRALAPHGRRSAPWLAAGTALWLAAVLSKESAVAFPLMAWWSASLSPPEQDADRNRVQVSQWPWLGAAAVALASSMGLRLVVLGSIRGPWPADPIANPAAGLDLGGRLATSGQALLHACRLLLWPWPLRADYGQPVLTPVAAASIPGMLGLAALAAAATLLFLTWWWRRRLPARVRPLLLGAGLVLLAWLPVSSLGPLPGSLLAERYLVLPSLGLSLLVATLVFAAGRRGPVPWLAATLLILAWTGLVVARVPVWHDDARLFAQEQILSPHSAKIDYFAGLMAFSAGSDTAAAQSFAGCLAAAPSFSLCHEGLARVELRRQRLTSAATAARAALRHAPPHPPLAARYRVLLAEILWEQGDPGTAEPLLREAAAMDPATATAPRRLGDLLQGSGRSGEAVIAYRQAVTRAPGEPIAAFNLAMALLSDGQDDMAANVLTDLAARPDAPHAVFYHLGVLAQEEGQNARARQLLERFVRQAGDSPRRNDARSRLQRLAD